jgi:hypothetical protein
MFFIRPRGWRFAETNERLWVSKSSRNEISALERLRTIFLTRGGF